MGALSGYRILDLADSNGAYCTKLLADLGADVIKVESPRGDPGRRIPPFAGDSPHIEKSLYFLYRNANKRGITLDIESPDGQTALKNLVKTADVLVENSPPGYLAGLGLQYESLHAINPGLVMTSITEFGQTGPYKDRKGSNLVDFAMSNAMISSGFLKGVPCMLPGSFAYDSASLIAAISILIALYARAATGDGQYIDTSVHRSSRICIHPMPLANYSYTVGEDGAIPPMIDMRLAEMSYPVYPCKDGFARIMPNSPGQWDALVRVLGSPEVLLLPEWREIFYRIGNAEDLYPLMQGFTRKYGVMELFDLARKEGVPIAPVWDIAGIIDDVNTKARESFLKLDHPVAGEAYYPAPPYKWTGTPPGIRRPAPCLGEHNDEVKKELSLNNKHKAVCLPGNPGKGDKTLPLVNVRVLSFGVAVVGPDCAKTLGEFGADVIKIESKDHPDMYRLLGPDVNTHPGFNDGNRNKRSLAVNLRTEEGRQIVRQLILKSDILLENFRGGVMKRFGLDYSSVRQLKPDIIYISSQGFGADGPYSEYEAYGPTVSAMSGILCLCAHPYDPYPVGSTAPIPDHIVAKHAVVAALAALDYRRRSKTGQYIDLAQTAVASNLIGEAFLEYSMNKKIPKPAGNRNPIAAPHGCYPCQGEDQWCAIAVFTDEEWKNFCKVIGNPSWTKEPEFADLTGRLKNVEKLDKLVGEWTSIRNAHDVVESLQSSGVAAGVVQHIGDMLEDPQLKWDNALIELDHPVVGKKLYPGIPYRLSGIPPLPSVRAPLLGEHTVEICHDLLEISDKEIQGLVDEGILYSSTTMPENK